jgi:hypothetical protein
LVRVATALAAAVLLAGCGVPQELSKQAEEVGSVAAEGALLAHDAGEGSSTEAFTSEHAKALRKLVEEVRPAIEQQRLGQIAGRVSAALEQLAAAPGDRNRAVALERELEEAAAAAQELAG